MKRNILNLKNLVYLLIISVFILTGCHYIDEEYKHPEGIFVSVKRGNDANDGSMERPLKTILTALNLAVTRSVKNVLVEEGTYINWNGLNDQYGVYMRSSVMDYSNITLSGGWVSIGKYYFCEQTGNSILDAQYASGIYAIDHNSLDIYGNSGTLSNITIEKFTITGGNCGNGGGIYINTVNNLMIIDCIIKNNRVTGNGGAIVINGPSNVLIKNCLISSNVAISGGGGIYVDPTSSVTIEHCFITNNSSSFLGGGIVFFNGNSVKLQNSIIISNSAPEGGGLWLSNCTNIYIENNFFIKNYGTTVNSTIYLSSASFTPPFVIKSNYFLGSGGTNSYFFHTTSSISGQPYDFINNSFYNKSFSIIYHTSGHDISTSQGLNDSSQTGFNNSSGNIIYNDEVNFDWFY